MAFYFQKFEVLIGDDVRKSYKRSYPKLTQLYCSFEYFLQFEVVSLKTVSKHLRGERFSVVRLVKHILLEKIN